MDRRKRQRLLIILLILVVISLFWVHHQFTTSHDATQLVLYGNIDIRQADLGFRVFGKLKSMYFEEGDRVLRGDLLAELDPEPYQQGLREAEQRVESLESSFAYAKDQYSRRSALVKGKSVSQEDFQQSYYNQKTIESNLEEAKASLQNAKIRLDDTRLVSPSDGTIYTRIREPGTVLNVGDPVYSVAVERPIWARTYVSELNLGNLYPGQKARVYTDTPQNPVYQGHIGFISPIAEFTPKSVETPDLRTNLVYQVRVIIDNPDEGLRQGMPVTVKIDLN